MTYDRYLEHAVSAFAQGEEQYDLAAWFCDQAWRRAREKRERCADRRYTDGVAAWEARQGWASACYWTVRNIQLKQRLIETENDHENRTKRPERKS